MKRRFLRSLLTIVMALALLVPVQPRPAHALFGEELLAAVTLFSQTLIVITTQVESILKAIQGGLNHFSNSMHAKLEMNSKVKEAHAEMSADAYLAKQKLMTEEGMKLQKSPERLTCRAVTANRNLSFTQVTAGLGRRDAERARNDYVMGRNKFGPPMRGVAREGVAGVLRSCKYAATDAQKELCKRAAQNNPDIAATIGTCPGCDIDAATSILGSNGYDTAQKIESAKDACMTLVQNGREEILQGADAYKGLDTLKASQKAIAEQAVMNSAASACDDLVQDRQRTLSDASSTAAVGDRPSVNEQIRDLLSKATASTNISGRSGSVTEALQNLIFTNSVTMRIRFMQYENLERQVLNEAIMLSRKSRALRGQL